MKTRSSSESARSAFAATASWASAKAKGSAAKADGQYLLRPPIIRPQLLVGSGAKAIVYLGRYLYRGVIQEKDILFCDNNIVRFRYRESKTNHIKTRTMRGVEFLRLLLQHILPRGFRRARDFGFLHANSKRMMIQLQLKLKIIPTPYTPRARPPFICACCGGIKSVIKTRIDMRIDTCQSAKPKGATIRDGMAVTGEATM